MHPAAKARYVAELIEGNKRSAKHYVCHKCGTVCLTGDDHDKVARVVIVDAEPISLIREMFYVLDDRATFDLVPRSGNTAQLAYREPWHIHGPTPDKYPILVEHQCDG